jgi:hypothetical protein
VIEANPEKISTTINMQPPMNKKQVQKLTGRLVALNRFIARSAKRGLSFFRVLRNSDLFEWGAE